ncbi:MAG: ABC transporter substrate-binding protein, partial [Bacillota bacterium]
MSRPELARTRGRRTLRPGALLLAALLILTSLAGCTRQTDKPFQGQLSVWVAAPPGTADAGGNLNAGEATGAERALRLLQDAARAYESTHPGVRVSIREMTWPELNAQLDQAMSGSDWADLVPDLATVSAQARPNPSWLAKGALEDVTAALPQEAAQDTWPFALDAFRDGKGLYGVPIWTTVQALYLNLNLFAERGVQPPASGHWTYEEFTSDVRRLTYARADGTQVAGLGVPLRAGSYELWPFLFGDGARPLSPNGSAYTLDQGAGPFALQRVLGWRQAGSPWVGTDQVPELFAAFALPGRRNVAIAAWDSWALDELQRSPELRDSPMNLRLAAYPAGPAGEATIGQAGGLVVFK